MTGLLFDADEYVANWLGNTFKYDRAIGLIDKEQRLIGAVLFHSWNGHNVELSYFGKNTLSAGIVRCLALYVIKTFNPSRVTVTTSKRNRHLMRSLQKFGFRVEGTQRCHYGRNDSIRNTGVRFVMFRPRLAELAGISEDRAA